MLFILAVLALDAFRNIVYLLTKIMHITFSRKKKTDVLEKYKKGFIHFQNDLIRDNTSISLLAYIFHAP